MGRGKKSYPKAFRALQRLRPSTIQAGRDIYYIHVLMLEEQKLIEGKSGKLMMLLCKIFIMSNTNRLESFLGIIYY